MSLTSPMDGIPYLIWRDFPHPQGPNEHGRGLVPFTDFEITLARQILSCSLYRQQHIQAFVDSASVLPLGTTPEGGKQRERVVRELPKRARESASHEDVMAGDAEVDMRWESGSFVPILVNDALRQPSAATFMEAPEEDDASTDGSEPEIAYHVENPSLFSHRSTVQDLIDSFHHNAIGPLAGMDVREDNDTQAPVVIVSEAPSLETLDSALEKWEAEKEERELEMRWRATKRVSENWLTRVGPVRERRREREEQLERDREQRKGGTGAMGKLVAKDGAALQQGEGTISWPQSHPLVQHSRSQGGAAHDAHVAASRPPPAPQVPLHPIPQTTSTAPPSSVSTASQHVKPVPSLNAILSPSITTAPPPSTPSPPGMPSSPITTTPPVTTTPPPIIAAPTHSATPIKSAAVPHIANTSELSTELPNATDSTTPTSAAISMPDSAATIISPETSLPPASASAPSPTSAQAQPLMSMTSAPVPRHIPTRPYTPHMPYDPRVPYFKDLPLEDLIHVPLDVPELQQLTFADGPQEYESLRGVGPNGAQQDHQQRFGTLQRIRDPAMSRSGAAPYRLAQQARSGRDPVGCPKVPCERPPAPTAPSNQPQAMSDTPSSSSDHLLSVPNNNTAFLALSMHGSATKSPNPLLPSVSTPGGDPSINSSSQPEGPEYPSQEPALQDGSHHGTSATQVSAMQTSSNPLPHSIAQGQAEMRSAAFRRGPQPHFRPQAPPGVAPPNGLGAPVPLDGPYHGVPHTRTHPQPHGPPLPHSHPPTPRSYPIPHPYTPIAMTQQERAIAQDKIMRHVTLLAQAPRITVGQVIVRNPTTTRASNLAPLFLSLFPEYAAGRDAATRAVVDVLEGRAPRPTVARSAPKPATQSQASWPAPESIPPDLGSSNPLSPLPLLDEILPITMPVEVNQSPSLRPALALDTHAPPISALPHTRPQEETYVTSPASPLTPTGSAYTDRALYADSDFAERPFLEYAPTGKRLVRVAKGFAGDVLGPTYWFEPDTETAERLLNVINLMERSGGWKSPERKIRIVGGKRKASGPDDLVA